MYSEINATSNRLLSFLSAQDAAILAPHLNRVSLETRRVLEPANQEIESIYFPEDGVVSVVGGSPAMGTHEIALIGREGMTGIMVVLGSTRTPLEAFVQIAGSALVMSAIELKRAMAQSPRLRDDLLMYVQVYLIQTSSTGLANAKALLPQRLARWLLMCQDRLCSEYIPITHQFLSTMLGVQRSGVTLAMHELEVRGLIRGTRGLVRVLDRAMLIKLTLETYGTAERAYERLFASKQHPAKVH